MTINIILIIVTVGVSALAFQNRLLFEKLLLSPYMMVHRKEWYRAITHGFIHVNWVHLLVNMFVLYSFSIALLYYFQYFIGNAVLHFLIVYFGGMVFAIIPGIIKNRNNYSYRAVGASGAVAAVMFSCIFFDPWNPLYLFAIIPIPGILFGVFYIAYCSHMSRNATDNVAHDVHLYGALFGLVYPLLVKPELWQRFSQMLLNP